MGISLGDSVFHVHCRTHKCELDEIEHYEDWFLKADFSGFVCPGSLDEGGNLIDAEFEKCDWAVSPIGRDDVNILDLIPKKENKS